jgi:hypothetical protein
LALELLIFGKSGVDAKRIGVILPAYSSRKNGRASARWGKSEPVRRSIVAGDPRSAQPSAGMRGMQQMRKHWMFASLLALTGALLGPALNRAHAQSAIETIFRGPTAAIAPMPWEQSAPSSDTITARGQWDVSNNDSTAIQNPLPLGPDRLDQGGIYGAAEFLFMSGSRALGHQVIASRGFLDSDGSITGTPGTFVGSHNQALTTDQLGRTAFVPGVRLTMGYKLEDGSAFSVSYVHLESAVYTTSAGPIPANFQTGAQGADAFLFAPVFGFSPQFSGPPDRLATANGTPIGSGGSPYGIWNGANTMDIKYTQRFDNWDLTYRSPVLETDYARSWVVCGGRFAWIWERFGWNTVASDAFGNSGAEDAADYVNIQSQRMYGPFAGIGNEVWLGNKLSLQGEVSVAGLFAISKQEAKYYLSDESTGSKRNLDAFTFVPNMNASVNLCWFPISNVQCRIGYDFWSFFNTFYMNQPVGFDAGAPDPAYNHRVIRFFQGLNFGVSLTF